MKKTKWKAVIVSPANYLEALAHYSGTRTLPFVYGQEELSRQWLAAGGGLAALALLLQGQLCADPLECDREAP